MTSAQIDLNWIQVARSWIESLERQLKSSPARRAGFSYFLASLIALIALVLGLQLRWYVWSATDDIHLNINLINAIDWGRHTNDPKVGVLKVYDLLVKQYGDDGDYRGPAPMALDYPPLRLLIVAQWTAWADRHYPARVPGQPVEWKRDYGFNAPMLRANTIGEIAGAAAMFLVVRFWIRRCDRHPTPATRGLWPALLAALLVWFNPALIWNAHAAPQWDAWLLAPFLMAINLALRDRWLVAGLLLGVAAMAKGQILIVMPVLVFWPLWSFRIASALALLSGFTLGIAATVSPWLIPEASAAYWVAGVVLAMPMLTPLFFYRGTPPRYGLIATVAGVAALLIFWPFLFNPNPANIVWAAFLLQAMVLGAVLLPRSAIATWASASLSAAAFLCVPFFNGSTAWYSVGLAFSTRHWKQLAWRGPSNLASLLQHSYGWGWAEKINLSDYVPFLDGTSPTPMRYLLMGLYGIFLLLCGASIAMHVRRRDPRLLYAIATPWLLMFALLPQMMPRYLMWGVVFGAGAAALELHGFVLYLLLSLINVINMVRDQTTEVPAKVLASNPFITHWLPFLRGTLPGLAWAVLLLIAMWLCLSLMPLRHGFLNASTRFRGMWRLHSCT